jgi:thioredoxin reductase (NADPH)
MFFRHAVNEDGDYDDQGPTSMSKLVCHRTNPAGGAEAEKVVGVHFIGPNAGEVMQGLALAVQLGATKADFDRMVGIHPTDAEAFSTMTVTKRSGENWVAAGGCGGGKCG